ncbi:MAG TPA: DUF3040 domain-containing protein [Acidimicrobiia bacterium]|nr:DUF3040 domain-containing protein [Acidimicrobiia bacterium]
MANTDEGVVLTDREREALASLAASIGDPWLAGQLAGHASAAPPRRRRRAWRHSPVVAAISRWLGLLLVLAGAALAVASFILSPVVASLGLAVMGVGLWRFVVDRGDGIVGRVTGRYRAPDAAG